jgi:glycosyltransferase involved in cell wall biosynthesis
VDAWCCTITTTTSSRAWSRCCSNGDEALTSISAVLPAYNEEALIADTATSVCEALDPLIDDYEVIVVNDGSKDRTQEVVEALAAKNPHVRLVNHEVNRGYGDALRTGFSSATRELIFFTDGDKQFARSRASSRRSKTSTW